MKYFSVEFHGVGLEYIEEFEDLFKSHGQGFNAIKSRVKKEQISPKLFRNQFNPWWSENSPFNPSTSWSEDSEAKFNIKIELKISSGDLYHSLFDTATNCA